MISQCVTVGTEVKLNCPVDDSDLIYWFYDDDIYLDYDYSEASFTSMLSTNSYGRGYETYKISCRTTDSLLFYFAVVIVTGKIQLSRSMNCCIIAATQMRSCLFSLPWKRDKEKLLFSLGITLP